ncbi:MAG TPA: DNA ligase D [Terriglobales bacterium]|nr:DNA ligase D [Terriglobales bacterium]
MTTGPQHRRLHRASDSEVQGGRRSKLPAFYGPELATLVDRVPQGSGWLYEIKLDGYRMLCRIHEGRASFLTRHAQDWTGHFKGLASMAEKLPVREALLDGEVVAMDENGKPDFQLLQNSLHQKGRAALLYYVFDLLFIDGQDVTHSPLRSRKALLQKLLAESDSATNGNQGLRYSEHWNDGEALFKKSCSMGLEGIVAKRADSSYHSGRTRAWLKVKCMQSQEFVIGGFTDAAGSRKGFGALLLGVYDDKQALHYAGRVGTGFTDERLVRIRARLDKVSQPAPAFVDPPQGREAKGVHWIRPEIACEVVFTGWTKDHVLRHPSFKGLREDKPAKEIRREVAASTAEVESTNPHRREGNEIAGIKLTHPERVLYPDQGITKIELARYYAEIADGILPHLEGRPLTLLRCPQGNRKHCFYQRHSNESLEPAIHPIPVANDGSKASYLYIDSLPGLITLVQMGVLELHTWGARRPHLDKPDRLTFDLDPDPSISWSHLKEAAQRLRRSLADLGLQAFVKSTGGKGLHVVVPQLPRQNWQVAKKFARAVAHKMAREQPDRYTATMSKSKRKGKIFIDYLRNAKTASAICAYSTRAAPGAPVSVPLRWEELKRDIRNKFTMATVRKRWSRLRQDPWRGYEAARKTITADMMEIEHEL